MTTPSPSIEVVIPAHNAAAFLRETLDSVAAQTLPPALVTVVDDRSTDGTPALVEQAARDLAPRLAIRLLRSAGPPGPSAARNTAIRASTAEWIAFCDADDLMLPAHHAILASLTRSPGVVLAFGDSCLFDSGTRKVVIPSHHQRSGVTSRPSEPLPDGGETLGTGMFEAILTGAMVCTSACLVNRAGMVAAGLFDEEMKYSEDAHLWMRLATRGTFAFSREMLTWKRQHGSNLSHRRNTLAFRRGECVSLCKLAGLLPSAAQAEPLRLNPAQQEALAAALRQAMWAYLYQASVEGPAAYLAAARLCGRCGHAPLALQPRHLARLAVRGVLGGVIPALRG